MNTEKFYQYWQEWFAQPVEVKEKFRRVKGPCEECGEIGWQWAENPDQVDGKEPCLACNGTGRIDRGNWYPPFSESPGYTGEPDPKEYFHWTLKDHRHDGADVTLDVFWNCYDTSNLWMRERGLEGVADQIIAEDCVLRILHYLPTPDGLAGEEHKDLDLLTVNVGGTCPGLEVLRPKHPLSHRCVLCTSGEHKPTENGCWVPREGGIHVGEMLEIYTTSIGEMKVDGTRHPDGPSEFRATTHRVRLPPNTERFAAVFFVLPPEGFVLRPGLTKEQYLADALNRAGTAEGARE